MVRFQYDHNRGQWRWNISKNAEKLDERILDTLRSSMGDNEFTYATVGKDEFVCMSALKPDGNSIIQGTVVGVKGKFNDMPEKPSCYIKKWGRKDFLLTDDIPAGEIPSPDTEVDYEYFPDQLGYILDAVMFGSKKVVIIVASNDEAMDCIKAINYMLPAAYAKKIGFSVGANTIPDTSINVMTDMGKAIPVNVKVYFTTADRVSTASTSYHVFDIDPKTPTNNYRTEISEFAKVVDEFCMNSKMQMDMMAQHIADAFDADGNLDKEMLSRLSLLFRFTITPDDETAKKLVEAGMGNGRDVVQVKAFLGACRHFWRHGNPAALSERQRQKMVEAYNSNNGAFNKSDSVEYLGYLIKQNAITNDEKDVLANIAVDRDCLANNSEALFCNPDFVARNTVFDILTQMLFKNPNIYSCEELISNAIRYFDINNCFAVLEKNGEFESGEELFSLITKDDKDIQATLAAILMSSCFMTTASTYSPHTHIRFNGLRRIMTKEKMTPIEQITFIIRVHHKMSDIANFGSVKMNDISHFLCDRCNTDNAPLWSQWILETISSLNIAQLIDLGNELISSDYIGLKGLVEGKLLNIKYVAPELRNNENVLSDYTRLFNMLNHNKQYNHIAKHLRNLKNEAILEEKFLEARWNFLKGAYDTLSDGDRRKIGEMHTNADDHQPERRVYIASRIQNEFLSIGKIGNNNTFFSMVLPIINMIAWIILAFGGTMLLDKTASKLIMENHSSIFADFFIIPLLCAVASAIFFRLNEGRKLASKNILTAIETVVFILAMLIAFYGSIALLGLIIR